MHLSCSTYWAVVSRSYSFGLVIVTVGVLILFKGRTINKVGGGGGHEISGKNCLFVRPKEKSCSTYWAVVSRSYSFGLVIVTVGVLILFKGRTINKVGGGGGHEISGKNCLFVRPKEKSSLFPPFLHIMGEEKYCISYCWKKKFVSTSHAKKIVWSIFDSEKNCMIQLKVCDALSLLVYGLPLMDIHIPTLFITKQR